MTIAKVYIARFGAILRNYCNLNALRDKARPSFLSDLLSIVKENASCSNTTNLRIAGKANVIPAFGYLMHQRHVQLQVLCSHLDE